MRTSAIILSFIGFVALSCGDDFGANDQSPQFDATGTGGSTARFNITGDFLYVVNNTELKAFDITNPEDPTQKSSYNLGSGIETIFGYKDNLFIGSQFGMQIFSINQDGSPSFVSDFTHTTACDPVIANDQYAYITIRSGLGCDNWRFEANQLITLDITNLRNPIDVDWEQMQNPRGLAFFQGDLFVGEGPFGLKRFSLEDPSDPKLIAFYEDIPANDMIPLDSILIITRNEGIFQFGIEDDSLKFFSPIQ